MQSELTIIQKEILRLLMKKSATYASPVNSTDLGNGLNAAPSYIREQAKILEKKGRVAVRRGPGGGYFVYSDKEYSKYHI